MKKKEATTSILIPLNKSLETIIFFRENLSATAPPKIAIRTSGNDKEELNRDTIVFEPVFSCNQRIMAIK